jgi:putative glutamine transport system substrate-binding protein
MFKKFTMIALCLILALGTLACSKPAENNTTTSGNGSGETPLLSVLKVGVKQDVPGFGLIDPTTNTYEGLEIDLAHLLAKELTGDESKVEFTPVTAQTRTESLNSGDLDLVIATFTITEERRLSQNFSTPYYTDAVGLLVKSDSGIKSLADCEGKTIGVARSATSEAAIQAGADELGVKVNFESYDTYPDIKAALDSGNVQVFSVDKSILRGYLDSTTEILPDAFSPQEYGVASKLENTALRDKVEELITKWISDGTIKSLIEKHNL